LAVTEPCSTGLGRDAFCLLYTANDQKISCLNGSGRSPASLTYDHVRITQSRMLNNSSSDQNIDIDMFRDSALAVTVPGAAAAWEDLWSKHGSGKYTFAELLEPAAMLAIDGFPVAPITSFHWRAGSSQIQKWWSQYESDNDNDTEESIPKRNPLTDFKHLDGPQAGEIAYNSDMARVLRELGEFGARDGFYCGTTGSAMVDVIQKYGGCLTLDDLASHQSEWVEPISAEYRNYQVWQAPPNGQGVAGLVALTGLQYLEEKGLIQKIDSGTIGGADAYHSMIEMMRLGFSDARAYVSDSEYGTMPVSQLLDPLRVKKRVDELFRPDIASIQGSPDASSCTVSFQVIDSFGNAISMVNSNFQGFGTGLIPENCGFTLQNRGFGFNFHIGHPNCIGPKKRPCHTILPALLTHSDTGELYATLSNMGGNMQPQGHMQLTVNMLSGDLDPQEAIDFPRFCIVDGTQDGIAYMEDGIDETVIAELQRRGHKLTSNVQGYERSIFGRAQIIKRDRTTGVLWAGSDGRADGCAMGF
jgi:gamma-glutamyltranspeptidase / glutathione hydrolase